MRRRASQPPLFPEPCLVCRYAVPGEHEPYCPAFMRGAEPGGDPHEWPSLLDESEEEPPGVNGSASTSEAASSSGKSREEPPAVRVVDIDTRLAEARAEIDAIDAGTHPAIQRGDEAA